MTTCEYIDARGKRCSKPTTESGMLKGKLAYLCPDHRLAVAEQKAGRPFKESPKPKS